MIRTTIGNALTCANCDSIALALSVDGAWRCLLCGGQEVATAADRDRRGLDGALKRAQELENQGDEQASFAMSWLRSLAE